MAKRTIVGCDRCGTEPADELTIGLGNESRAIDLCQGCQETFGLAKLGMLLEEYGAPLTAPHHGGSDARKHTGGRVANPSKRDPWQCPFCPHSVSNRKDIINHVMALHGMDKAAASVAVPPRNQPTIKCSICGYLTNPGPGLMQHRRADHDIPFGVKEGDEQQLTLVPTGGGK
jgi:hypothetical protein